MKNKHYKFIIPCIALGLISNAYGLSVIGPGTGQELGSCSETSCPSSTGSLKTISNMQDPYCASQQIDSDATSWTSKCYKDQNNDIFKYSYCNRCMSGYTLSTAYANPCNQQTGIQMQFQKCECICTNCGTSSWSAGNTGYQQRTTGSCSCTSGSAKCNEHTEYRCADGYYGSSTNGTSGCTRCPGSEAGGLGTGDIHGYSNAGTTTITGCYLSEGDEICDSTGCFDLMSDCYWKN